MNLLQHAGLRLMRLADPEDAHAVALKALRFGLAGGGGPITSPALRTRLAGLELPNPVGVAAGFDKNAVAVDATLKTGFGFCEIGAVTPRPQDGNPRPRLFRLTQDRAAINRFGFNNDGMDAIRQNLTGHRRNGVIGVNLGANKDTEDKAEDYIAVLMAFSSLVSFATVNVSSPNTEKLRDLQGRAALEALLRRILEARANLPTRIPVFLKIAPDLDDDEISDIAEVCADLGIDAIVATNTTVSRAGLRAPQAVEKGGLSGAPLMRRSTEVLRKLRQRTEGRVPLVGVGGICSAEDAYAKIRAGASAVQLYTAMVYEGPGLGASIARELEALLARDGFKTVAQAVGTEETP